MARFLLVCLLWKTLTITSHQEALSEQSVTVYPKLFESRHNVSEKVLVIHDGYSLNLHKGSVLADTVLLRDLTDSGVVETYIAGKEHERDLYQDSEKKASLLLKPQEEGQYHIVGLLNSTHLIEPYDVMERSSEGVLAHKISPIESNAGINAAVEVAERSYEARAASTKQVKLLLPSKFIIELAVLTDSHHTRAFGNNQLERLEYLKTLLLAASLRMQQFNPPGFISVVMIQGSVTEQEPYVELFNETTLLGTPTLHSLSRYAKTDATMNSADALLLVTGREVAENRTKYISIGHKGLAFTGKACTQYKVGLAVDMPKTYSGVQPVTHELAHLVGADHDGEGKGTNCSLSDGYLMATEVGGRNHHLFSNCSAKAVRSFLVKPGAACLRTSTTTSIVVLPWDYRKAQNFTAITDGYCGKFFPDHEDVSYTEPTNDANNCHIRCKLRESADDANSVSVFAPTGTVCSEDPRKICYYGLCLPTEHVERIIKYMTGAISLKPKTRSTSS